ARATTFTAKHRPERPPEPNSFETRPADDARADLAWLPQADHREADGGEIAERGQRLDALAHILDFRHGERDIFGADAARALSDIDQPVFAAIDERPQKHTTHHAENGGVGPDAERQRERHRDSQPFSSSERAARNSKIMKKQPRVHSTSLRQSLVQTTKKRRTRRRSRSFPIFFALFFSSWFECLERCFDLI